MLIDDSVPWVDGYRGLFGLDTYDRFAGERPPAGPKYTRSGTVRQTWNDPLGFAGLDKMAPPSRQPEQLRARIDGLVQELAELDVQGRERAATSPGLELEVRALAVDGSMAKLHEARSTDLAAAEHELAQMHAKRAGLTDTLLAARQELVRIEAGDFGDPRAHLQHDEHPVPPQTTRYGLIIELWSAISVSLMLLLIVGLIWFRLVPWFGALAIGVVGYMLIEAAFRRRLTVLMLRTSLFLAVIAAAILLWEFRLQAVLAGIVAVAVVIFADNIREVIRR